MAGVFRRTIYSSTKANILTTGFMAEEHILVLSVERSSRVCFINAKNEVTVK